MVRTGADAHELEFKDMVFERDGVRIRYRGSIDRVDVSVDDRVPGRQFVAAIDYKTSEWSTPGAGKPSAWDEGIVLQVPLYAHALQTLRPGSDIARVEYQALKSPKQVHSLELYTIDKKTKCLVDGRQSLGEVAGRARSCGRARAPRSRWRVSGGSAAELQMSAVVPRSRHLPHSGRPA